VLAIFETEVFDYQINQEIALKSLPLVKFYTKIRFLVNKK
jgi:hypothetical protein